MNTYPSKEMKLTFLEKLASIVPGVHGYLKKEKARESDQRYRSFLADALTEVKDGVHAIQEIRLSRGYLADLDKLELVCRKIDEARDSIRYASHGYSGLFDGIKIKQNELEQLMNFDRSLMDLIRDLGEKTHTLTPSASQPAIDAELFKSMDDAAE
ncbi:hypothetical protein JW979_08040, partial [bacterium]|nr:hypothetical protein [candidate division CSSED10-310 bacterium]